MITEVWFHIDIFWCRLTFSTTLNYSSGCNITSKPESHIFGRIPLLHISIRAWNLVMLVQPKCWMAKTQTKCWETKYGGYPSYLTFMLAIRGRSEHKSWHLNHLLLLPSLQPSPQNRLNATETVKLKCFPQKEQCMGKNHFPNTVNKFYNLNTFFS